MVKRESTSILHPPDEKVKMEDQKTISSNITSKMNGAILQPPDEKSTMEEQKTINNNNTTRMCTGQILTFIVVATIVGVFLIVSDIVLLVQTVRVVSDRESIINLTRDLDKDVSDLTNLARSLSERVDQDINGRPLNLKMCAKDKPCQVVDNTASRQLCFKLNTDQKTWFKAKQECESLGGYLAEVTGPDIHYFVKPIITGPTWIGGSDLLNEGEWRWNHSGTDVGFAAWRSGYPNANNNKDCMYQHSGIWDEDACSSPKNYMCEKTDNDTNCEAW